MQVIAIDSVAEFLNRLRHLGAHRNTIMYLCIKRASAQQGTLEDVEVDFREFFERFLTISNAPQDRNNKPYLIPFEESDAKIWLNRNLAGSFSPSSVRPGNPINTIILTLGKGVSVRYTLKPNHSRLVFNNLLNGQKIPALELAGFLYRDFGFTTDEIDAEMLLNIFAEEFGYIDNGKFTSDFNEVFIYNPESAPDNLFTEFIQL